MTELSVKYSIRNILVSALVTGGLAVSAAPAAAENVQWTMATWGGGLWLEVGAKNFAQRVDLMTEGRVKIDVAAPGMMGSPVKITETVQSGIAEVGMQWAAYDAGVDKAAYIFAGWSGGLSPEEFMMWLYKGGGVELIEQWRAEEFGVVSIPCNLVEPEIFLHSHKPVRTLEDFKGLRIRTGGAWAEIAAELGATTVVLPGAEVFDAFERGVVDAVEWGGPGVNMAAGFQNISEYIIVPGIHQPGSLNECMFNKDAWAKVSEHDQEVIRAVAKLNILEAFLAYADSDLNAWKTLHESKVEFVELDQSFIDKAREVSLAWADKQAEQNPWFKKVYESQRAMQGRLQSWGEFRLPVGTTKVDP